MTEETIAPEKELVKVEEIVDNGDGTYLVKGHVCKKNKNDAYYDIKTGRIVLNPGGGKFGIKPETAREVGAIYRKRAELAKLRGMIIGAGLEVPEDVENLLEIAGMAEEAVVAHMMKTFLASPNLRGMAEIRKALTVAREPEVRSVGQGGEYGGLDIGSISNGNGFPQLTAILIGLVNEKAMRIDAIDAEVVDG